MKKLIMMSALALGLAACADQEAVDDDMVDDTVVTEPEVEVDENVMDDGDRGGEDDRTLDGGDDAMDGDRGGEDDRI